MPKKSSNRFYVYTLIDPRCGGVFYVGKGTGRRMFAHEAEWRRGEAVNAGKFSRIDSIKLAGLEVGKKIVAAHLTEDEAFQRERDLIASLLPGGRLTNIASGAETAAAKSLALARFWAVRIRPFAEWFLARKRTGCDVLMYWAVTRELRKEAA